MQPIYTQLQLKNYIKQVERQQEVLQLSTVFTALQKHDLTETYKMQIAIATRQLELIEAVNL